MMATAQMLKEIRKRKLFSCGSKAALFFPTNRLGAKSSLGNDGGGGTALVPALEKKGEMYDTLRENITFLQSVINKLVNLYLNDHHIVIEEKKLAMRM